MLFFNAKTEVERERERERKEFGNNLPIIEKCRLTVSRKADYKPCHKQNSVDINCSGIYFDYYAIKNYSFIEK